MPTQSTDIDKLVTRFLAQLEKEQGKTAIQSFINGLYQNTQTSIYTIIMFFLTNEDLTIIDQIKDEKEAEKEIRHRFKQRAGADLNQFVDIVIQNYTELFSDKLSVN